MKTIDQLNQLLASLQVSYQNLRAFHWNIQGKTFFTLHTKFEELYTETLVRIDDVAERILTSKSHPYFSFTTYVEKSVVKEHPYTNDGETMVRYLIKDMETIIEQLTEIEETASEIGDIGTSDLITGYVYAYEKELWMLNAFVS